MRNDEADFHSLRDAEEYAHVTAQALYKAIRKGDLRAVKERFKGRDGRHRMVYSLTKKDIDEYKSGKYLRDKRKINGVHVFDIDRGDFSVLHISKLISSALGRPYPPYNIYYRLRMGDVTGRKIGRTWILSRETAQKLYDAEVHEDQNQVRFA